MSGLIQDTETKIKEMGISINNFLYEDGKQFLKKGKKGKLIHHSEEEYVEFLSNLADECFDTSHNISTEMGYH